MNETTILVVEDHPGHQAIYKTVMESSAADMLGPVQLTIVATPEAALEYLATISEKLIVISDLNFARSLMKGWDFLSKVAQEYSSLVAAVYVVSTDLSGYKLGDNLAEIDRLRQQGLTVFPLGKPLRNDDWQDLFSHISQQVA